jgi:hypothetical protein
MLVPETGIAVSILEKIFSFLEFRGERNRRHFEDYIEPVYKDTEIVAGNYIEIFTELEQLLQSADSIEVVKRWLETRRGEFAVLRNKLERISKIVPG